MKLSFIFCWRKHYFCIIIQIFLTKQFFFNIWTADNLNIVDPSFRSFLRDLQIDNILLPNKYTNKVEWDSKGLNDAIWRIFPEIDEKLLMSAKISDERWSKA